MTRKRIMDKSESNIPHTLVISKFLSEINTLHISNTFFCDITFHLHISYIANTCQPTQPGTEYFYDSE